MSSFRAITRWRLAAAASLTSQAYLLAFVHLGLGLGLGYARLARKVNKGADNVLVRHRLPGEPGAWELHEGVSQEGEGASEGVGGWW